MRLCEERPELRKKLAAELVRQHRPVVKTADVEDNYMVLRSLMKMSERAPEILELIGSDASNLEDWQEFKINLAAEYLDSVYDSIRFRLQEMDL